ncbi:DUF3667 domain-containing protein [Dokdonella soli]|uniref:DUF3667 domain-containing protein n=1 Tax=Dokdonella soli TaxID=529810 RepID=A0ABN1IDC6_9GAMM
MAICTNCGATLAGEFCQACGQKRFVESDRRFGHLMHQFLASATDLDGRIWRSLRALLFQPGLLSREYFIGRRAHWIAPITLFLAVNVVYFLAPLHGGDLALQFNRQVSGRVEALASGPDEKLSEAQLASTGQAHTPFTMGWIDARVRARDAAARKASHGASGYSYHDYRVAYDAKADDVSKALIILHVPFVALVLMLLFARQHRYFAEHFVFALHFLAFTLLSLQLTMQIHALMNVALPAAWVPSGTALDWFLRLLLPTYTVLAVRRAYAVGWIGSIAAGVGVLAAVLAVNLFVYRAVEFAVTFALT